MQQHGLAGYEVLRALRDYGFRGRLYPVHESGRPVCGIPGHRTIAELPAATDLIVVAAGGGQATDAVREAGRCGIAGAVVLGVADTQENRELEQVARDYRISLVGPGSFGVFNTDPRVRLDATLSRARPPRGGLALACQSSAVGVALLEHVTRNGCGVASFVSVGDGRDLGDAGSIAYWYHDAHTRAVALFPDTPGDPQRLAAAVEPLSQRKPVLVVGGTGPDSIIAGSMEADSGIIHTSSLDEVTDAARMLVSQPLPAGNRLGIVGNAGALTAVAANTALAHGFVMPSGVGADVDIEAGAAEIAAAVDTVAGTGQVDMVLALVVGTRANCPAAIMTALAHTLDRRPGLTAAVVLAGSPDDIHRVGIRDIPVYRQQDRAIRALAHTHRYAIWRRSSAHDNLRRLRAGRP
ncbi:CoA-binding protein [Actinoplanes sp. TRM88002]|uniref:CoA-binding protein n=1 Tax=Paractinoplanes hotanensis TaxID=2906497 RepID=A0ABT0YEC8_9ACTN|nr:CoA-binding protein [Actinoplanes hotanensis]